MNKSKIVFRIDFAETKLQDFPVCELQNSTVLSFATFIFSRVSRDSTEIAKIKLNYKFQRLNFMFCVYYLRKNTPLGKNGKVSNSREKVLLFKISLELKILQRR